MCAFPFNLDHDFVTVTDGLYPVTLTRPNEPLTVHIAHALRLTIRTEEARHSGGHYTTSDVVWHLPAVELPHAPHLGDVLIDPQGRRWTLLQIQEAAQGRRWRCVARNLTAVHGLDQTVDIEKATYSKSLRGASQVTWAPWRTGLQARIQPRTVAVDERHDRLDAVAQFTVVLAENVEVDQTHRLKGPDGTLYRILASRRAERIDALMELDVERIT